MSPEAPLTVGSQWPEGRAFERLYHDSPRHQARLAMTLIGLRESLIMPSDGGEMSEAAQAVNTTLREFAGRYPEFLESAETDERLIGYMNEILGEHE